jgi:peroxiredoxin
LLASALELLLPKFVETPNSMRILILFFATFSFTTNAQTASDFTITDIDGNSRNLYSELDANKVVVLKFFTNWCSVCNNTADDVVAIYSGYQTAGEPVVFWALNRDQNETNADATTFRNNHNIPFPVIGEAYTVSQQFGVQYQPEYYIIKPDRSYVVNYGFGAMETAVDEALSTLTTGVNELSGGDDYLIGNNTISWNSTNNHRGILKILDLSGRTVSKYNLLGGETAELNLPNGVYLFSISVKGLIVATGKIPVIS